MPMTRRQILGSAALMGGLGVAGSAPRSAAATKTPSASFSYCLNLSTIRGQELGVVRDLEVAAEAGYDGVEPWIGPLNQYEADGGSIKDLAGRVRDLGLGIENAIGFARWIVDDDAERAKAFEQMKREMDLLRRLGGKRIAAPPSGATRNVTLELDRVAERYHDLLELGVSMEVIPQLEVWGSSENLHKLSQAAYVIAECGHPKACMLPDVYHLYRGGSDPDAIRLFGPDVIQIFHMNDYPAEPPLESIGDRDRIYPGDGIAPMDRILGHLRAAGGHNVLSLELFNRSYWEQDALEVAKTGLKKMRDAVARSA